MEASASLKTSALIIHDILDHYVVVDNDAFKPSLRRILPIPGVFESIDFERHCGTLARLILALEPVCGMIRGQQFGPPDSLEDEFAKVLADYAEALLEAIKRLNSILTRLKNEGHMKPATYTAHEYRADVKDYQVAVARYRSWGIRVNGLFARL